MAAAARPKRNPALIALSCRPVPPALSCVTRAPLPLSVHSPLTAATRAGTRQARDEIADAVPGATKSCAQSDSASILFLLFATQLEPRLELCPTHLTQAPPAGRLASGENPPSTPSAVWHDDEEPDAPNRHHNRAQRRRRPVDSIDWAMAASCARSSRVAPSSSNPERDNRINRRRASSLRRKAGGTAMARNDTRRFRDPVRRSCAFARGRRLLGARSPMLTVASTLVVAVVVSVLSLVEAVFSTSTTKLARRAPTSVGAAELARARAIARAFLTELQCRPSLRCSSLTKRDPEVGSRSNVTTLFDIVNVQNMASGVCFARSGSPCCKVATFVEHDLFRSCLRERRRWPFVNFLPPA